MKNDRISSHRPEKANKKYEFPLRFHALTQLSLHVTQPLAVGPSEILTCEQIGRSWTDRLELPQRSRTFI